MSFVYVSRIKSQVRGLEIRLSRAGNPYDDICTVNGRGGEGNQRYVSAPGEVFRDRRLTRKRPFESCRFETIIHVTLVARLDSRRFAEGNERYLRI
ncbi:PREDICTED: uncharacterized protein LOC106750299 isoform X4 [Dinoponera quadriceps]|uniref:Uncharacterized protein LOC106750299 isoform X4 n=1 Tax=Dinoponera quadriceps TaxID=609295 RepID=A0A6P3Y7M0_DINQU|nr:PREDICTED: uncharacterized protein LOC106750299 isoform X4 [Dinoponera quadriceps]